MVALVTVGALYAYKEYNRKNISLHEVAPNFTLKSSELLSQFSKEEKKATATYIGKTLLVSGSVKTVDKDEKGFYTIILEDPGTTAAVRCSLDSIEGSHAAGIQQNSTIQIKGICTGFNADELGLGSDLILNRCVIESAK